MAHQPLAQPVKYPYYEATVTETTWHYEAIAYLYLVLRYRYRERDDVFVGANNFVFWEEGNLEEKQAPDVYICFGARNIGRPSYKIWEEGGIVPQVAFEITSKSSRLTDLGTKKATYEMLGIEEYYAFDPLQEYIPLGLKSFRLEGEAYRDITPKVTNQASKQIRIYSPRLDLDLQAPPGDALGILRLYEPGTQTCLRSYEESELGAIRERVRAEQESARADRQQAVAEEQRALAEEQTIRAERYARKLAELGIDPDTL